MTNTDRIAGPPDGPLAPLAATGPHPAHADALMLFGQFVGSWDVEAAQFRPDGTRIPLRGEWHFGWVLEGRAVQDVLISPPRAEGAATTFEHGTTVRAYDPRRDTWNVVYVSPVSATVVTLTGRAVGEDIVQHGRAADGREVRWSFCDIATDRFRWEGAVRADGDAWAVDEEMRARRRAG